MSLFHEFLVDKKNAAINLSGKTLSGMEVFLGNPLPQMRNKQMGIG